MNDHCVIHSSAIRSGRVLPSRSLQEQRLYRGLGPNNHPIQGNHPLCGLYGDLLCRRQHNCHRSLSPSSRSLSHQVDTFLHWRGRGILSPSLLQHTYHLCLCQSTRSSCGGTPTRPPNSPTRSADSVIPIEAMAWDRCQVCESRKAAGSSYRSC